jgi:hypothetical protein
VKPNPVELVERKQGQQKQQHDRSAKEMNFEVGTCVYVHNYKPPKKIKKNIKNI